MPPTPPIGPAPHLSLDGESVADRRAAMRRNAVFHLFEAASLGPPPALLWNFVTDDDVGRAVERFLRVSGAQASPEHLDQLLRSETGLRAADPAIRHAWVADMLSGDPRRFATAALAARRHAAPRLAEHWPADLMSGSSTRRDAAQAEELAATLAEHEGLRRILLAHWPDTWTTQREGEQVRTSCAVFETEEVSALMGWTLGRSCVAGLARLRAANAELARLAAQLGQATPAVAFTNVDVSEITNATTWPEALRQWRGMRLRHHPDRPGITAEEVLERRRACATLDRALERREQLASVGPSQP